MCGFSGEIRFDGVQADARAVMTMCDVLAPRGPDGSGLAASGNVAMGHRRLKIIDLSERGSQPMTDPALGLTLVFNGCIYNYRELREKLEAKGYSFHSASDTEVVLKAWHAWRADAPTHMNGMFAFAVHERDSGRTALARDRLGIKPLYLSLSGKRLRFASTLPAILAAGDVDTSIDPQALQAYMTWHAVVPPPLTMLKGIRKLPPATVAIFEADGSRRDTVYWSLGYERSREDAMRSEGDWAEMLHASLIAAVDRRMIADVPVGVLLSGGVDSSLIVGLLAEAGQQSLNTFSIGFEAANGELGDEFKYSDIVAKHFGTEHHKIFVPSSELLDALPRTIGSMSEPMVSYDNVGFFLLSQEVAKHVKVVQSGQGADEVFAGYHWYPKLANSDAPASDYAAAFFDRDFDEYRRTVQPQYHDGHFVEEFIEDQFSRLGAEHAVDKALRLDTTIMLADDPVKRVDNMTMAWGLEARVPFLDHELVELAARIPAQHKLADGGKGILKTVARKVIPADVIDRPKGYFPVPALKYLDGPYLAMVRDALSTDAAKQRGLFNQGYLEELFANPSEHITPLRGSKLWQIGLLELWLQSHSV
ncbi:asparagine synthase (glutamine-hydrolyzing) [Parvibaculum lavamentivorans DS-1]|uniref:asparagine synthase (glutamine-hydrolyzing) n=1 Tax=Parvibaculum lavamentivorans (strain DS-1 / DSM 13023 / NCIMB 13966) TaxID=402881 RepID=A7HRA6_PARL1|nr:N-acetylglutaminylglutamine amidotransferase [Parvibaculum lavamentivorans]ABS62439.1 asparagine synthase (glutamine-hydrolyzing) [Parvibaculum lavamentivorans DS-1]